MAKSWQERKIIIKSLIDKLHQCDNIIYAKHKQYNIEVKFKSKIIEHWIYDDRCNIKKIPRTRLIVPFNINGVLFNDKSININYQYELNQKLYPEIFHILSKHIIVPKQQFQNSGFVNTRLFIDHLANNLINYNYNNIEYPIQWIKKYIYNAKQLQNHNHQKSLIYFDNTIRNDQNIIRIILNFIKLDLNRYWTTYNLHKTIHKLLISKNYNITIENIIYSLITKYFKVKSSLLYKSIFDKWLDIDNKYVLDTDPDIGFTALGVILCNGNYCINNPPQWLFDMSNHVGGEIIDATTYGKKYDLVIHKKIHYKNNNDIDCILDKYKNITQKIMITLDIDSIPEWKNIINKYKLKARILRIRKIGKNDMLLIINT